MTDRKTCPDCQSKIRSESRKCLSCGSLLDWRRYSGELSAFFALFLATIGVFTWAEPVFRKYAIGFKDELTVMSAKTYFNVFDNENSISSLKGIQIALSNTGDNPAIVQDIGVYFKFSKNSEENTVDESKPPKVSGVIYYNELPDIYKNPGILNSGKSELYRLFLTKAVALPEAKNSIKYYTNAPEKYSVKCKVSIDWVTSKGETKKLLKDFDDSNCQRVMRLVKMRMAEIGE